MIRFVMGESRVTAEAGKPSSVSQCCYSKVVVVHTNVTREHKKVVVGKSAIISRVEELVNIQPVLMLVVALENLQCLRVILDFPTLS